MESDWAEKKAEEIVNHHCFRDSQPDDVPVMDQLAKEIADALRAERALYEKAWSECEAWRQECGRKKQGDGWRTIDETYRDRGTPIEEADAHDAARKEMGL